ncbi:hypothetical protein niasHT_031843 [Heterodera trifolii]|uniref:Ankyrin repeat protein n=1 Tax=Heterodera trifolii TaxID=157864 RepID=A0ABD2HSY6_9BILA
MQNRFKINVIGAIGAATIGENGNGKLSPLWAAVIGKQTKTIDSLFESAAANPNENGTFKLAEHIIVISPLHFAANHSLEACKLLVANGAKTDQSGYKGIKPLHIASANGHMEIVKFFVEEVKADIETADADGDTALMYALVGQKLDIVRYLNSKGARNDRPNEIGLSPRMLMDTMNLHSSLFNDQ